MLFFSYILALLAIMSPISAQGFDKTYEFVGIEPYFRQLQPYQLQMQLW
jgi:hypothetical protein